MRNTCTIAGTGTTLVNAYFTMKRIPLSRGLHTIVGNEDYERLSEYSWHAVPKGGNFYAVRELWRKNERNPRVWMHREITGCPKGKIVDHANHDTLDNRRANLRVCSVAENSRNQKPRKSTSKYRGVHWCKRRKKWIASIRYNYKTKYCGQFSDESEAAKAYDKWAVKLHGEFSRPNFRCRALLLALDSLKND